MDIVLKGELDGIQTAQIIKDNYNTPFIYLTAYYDNEIVEKAQKTQPAAYITKPYEEKWLQTAILIIMNLKDFSWGGTMSKIHTAWGGTMKNHQNGLRCSKYGYKLKHKEINTAYHSGKLDKQEPWICPKLNWNQKEYSVHNVDP